MKSRLEVSFGGVADRERKHLGKKASVIRDVGHSGGGLSGRSSASWLLGLIPLEHPGGGSTGHSWAGQLLGLVPLGLLCWAGWLGELGPSPWYPQYVIMYLVC